MKIENIEVGTTETFQGREKRVIIISTVRSNRNLLDYDKKYNLGFLVSEKVSKLRLQLMRIPDWQLSLHKKDSESLLLNVTV